MEQKQKRNITHVTISVILAVVLGFVGYFGSFALFTGQNPFFVLFGEAPAPESDIPTDANGDNLYGNHAINLRYGGFMTMQGRDVFFVNFADGGTLYLEDRSGRVTKLTDFPVANLNVAGNRLVFTGIEFNTFEDEFGGITTFYASSHDEILDAAEMAGAVHISYGGYLYYLEGIKSYCAGEITADELVLTGMGGPEYYLSPYLAGDGEVTMITVTFNSPASYSMTRVSACGEIDNVWAIKFQPESGMEILGQPIQDGNNAYMTIYDNNTNEKKVGIFDMARGEMVGTLNGHTPKLADGKLHYVGSVSGTGSPPLETVYKYDPADGSLSQALTVPVSGPDFYEVMPNGDIISQTKDTDSGELLQMYTNKTAVGQTPEKPSPHGLRGSLGFRIRRRTSMLNGTRYEYNAQEGQWKRRNIKTYPLGGWSMAWNLSMDREHAFNRDQDKVMERWNLPPLDTPKSLKNAHWSRPDELQGKIECPSPLPETASAPEQTAPEAPSDSTLSPEPENDVIIDFTPEPEDEPAPEPPVPPSDASPYADLENGIVSGRYLERMFEIIFEFTADGILTIITAEGEIIPCTYLISYEDIPGYTRSNMNDDHYYFSIIPDDSTLEWLYLGVSKIKVEDGAVVTTIRHADYGSALHTGIALLNPID